MTAASTREETRCWVSIGPMMRITLSSAGVLLAAIGVACGGGSATSPTSQSTSQTTSKTDEAQPVLSVPNVATDQAVTFFVFGALLPSNLQNPTYEIETADVTPIVSASAAGKVVAIYPSSNGIDKTIVTKPSDASIWSIIYDHVSNPRVSVGQTIAPGTALGTVGVLTYNSRGRTELQINRDQTPKLAYCPQTFGTAAFNLAYTTAAQRINGSGTVCTAATITP